jgi:hypothetical protein
VTAYETSKIKARLIITGRDQEIADACAEVLGVLGFDISSASKRGVAFTGPPELFEKVFSATVELEKEPHFTTEPGIPENLKDFAEAVYFPTQPLYFEERE